MSDELLPCPFCGGEAKLHYHKGFNTASVSCQDYNCWVRIDVKRGMYVKDDVITRWNTRTPPAEPIDKALEAFKRVLEDFYHGIVGNRTVADNEADIETIRAALQQKPIDRIEELEEELENWKASCRRMAERPPVQIIDPMNSELIDELAAALESCTINDKKAGWHFDELKVQQALAKKKEME